MFIQNLKLQNYRCFDNKSFTFNKKLILLEGNNGSGKTTILEALHYSCFLRSFKTNRVKELISFDKDHFFLQINFEADDGTSNQVQVGLTVEDRVQKRLVKVNKKVVKKYKDLIGRYRVVSLSENDLSLVQGAPEHRRYFLDQYSILFSPEFASVLKNYRKILQHRNSFLTSINNTCINNSNNNRELEVWTRQLWRESEIIRKVRIDGLKKLAEKVNYLLDKYFGFLGITVSFKYLSKNNLAKNFDDFWKNYNLSLIESEFRFQRSLFGIHLDDFIIDFMGKRARVFASRGQQKLVVFLIKSAVVGLLKDNGIESALLLDDFLTDFDYEKLSLSLKLLSEMSSQIFISCPLKSLILDKCSIDINNIQVISL